MMEPKEITKEEYHQRVMANWSKARKLASKNNLDCDPAYFYSTVKPNHQERVCSYMDHGWSEYRVRAQQGTTVIHFMDIMCPKACPKTEVDCLAKVKNKGITKYYHCTHLVGLCPWKE